MAPGHTLRAKEFYKGTQLEIYLNHQLNFKPST